MVGQEWEQKILGVEDGDLFYLGLVFGKLHGEGSIEGK